MEEGEIVAAKLSRKGDSFVASLLPPVSLSVILQMDEAATVQQRRQAHKKKNTR